ncbi:aminotransferase class V-fold PLP-dependent enzyme [bacterium]|nr:aminotransferase class V-fold PLP-dependent enzyme [bacterium]
MSGEYSDEALRNRNVSIDISGEDFRKLGHALVDDLAEFLESLPNRKVVNSKSVKEVQALVGNDSLPQGGTDPGTLLKDTTKLLADYSLFNGHPGFMGYVTSSAAPIGMLGDFLASAVNQNVGAWQLSPVATEVEAQTISWIAELIGYPSTCGGLMVSGGNMANFVGFLAGRKSRTPWDIRKEGIQKQTRQLRVYCSDATHTWVHKAADLFSLGTDAIRWIPSDLDQHMDVEKLELQIEADIKVGFIPILVAASAGTVATGAVDHINKIADICEANDLWLHVDRAYGAMAAALPEASEDLKAISRADSVALDPHKWLYAPLEAGTTLVKNPQDLSDAFAFNPDYYQFDLEGDQPPTNYFELGLQNSRGFRALKVWLGFKQVGGPAFVDMIRQDIQLAQAIKEVIDQSKELESFTRHLSITTFRYVPNDLSDQKAEQLDYLNQLNEALLTQLQKEGEAFVSNAVLHGTYVLRACIVNFRTTLNEIEKLPEIVIRIGRSLDVDMRPQPS